MTSNWKESIYLQREQLGRLLHEPLAQLADHCVEAWGERERLNGVLVELFSMIPHCANLYCLDGNGVQICDNVTGDGIDTGHYGRDRSQRPYMQEALPAWGFLLSDAYIALLKHRPSLTALQVVRRGDELLGYLGADFDLRDLPVTSVLYDEPDEWRQIKGDPSIRGALFQQCRIESQMDRILDSSLLILEELLTQHGVFQCQIHFSSSQATVWSVDDPFRYRILEQEALADPDVCLIFPASPYPDNAMIPQGDLGAILDILKTLRTGDENIYLRMSSLNIFNGMISVTFSCDGTHYMRYDEFLNKDTAFWYGNAA